MRQEARKRRRKGARDRGEFAVDLLCKRRFEAHPERVAIAARKLAQPLIALAEHVREQRHRSARIVVEMRENAPPIAIVGLRLRQRVTNRSFVERARTLFEARDPA
jgi:hypothetical protein